MAWGYWTCYSNNGYGANRRGQQKNNELFYHPQKREKSQERLITNSTTFTNNTVVSASAASQAAASNADNNSVKQQQQLAHHAQHVQDVNHVEPEKVAFERRLLLGDPDWGSRTIADRNTLPRKKQPEYDKNSEVLYGGTCNSSNSRGERSSGGTGGGGPCSAGGGGGPNTGAPPRRSSSKMATTPPDSLSRKSDDNFCPACAQNSNRESRVSFGSLASSSGRGSSNQQHHQSNSQQQNRPNLRTRSRSQDDDDYSSNHGGILSSSLPTPPPPPFSSQRDLIRHQASLLETINQKMAFLSAFKLPPGHHGSVATTSQQQAAALMAAQTAGPIAAAAMAAKFNTIGPSKSAYYFSGNGASSSMNTGSGGGGSSGGGGGRDHEQHRGHHQHGGGGHHHRDGHLPRASSGGTNPHQHQQHHHQQHQQQQQQHQQQPQHRSRGQHRSSRDAEKRGSYRGNRDKTTSREHSSSSLHSLGAQRQRDCDNRQPRSSGTSRRTSRSGSRTPRSSRGSRESMGSRGSRGSRSAKHHHHHHSASKSIDLSELHPPEPVHGGRHHPNDLEDDDDDLDAEAEGVEAGDEADGDSDVQRPASSMGGGGASMAISSGNKPFIPPKPSLINPPVSFNNGSSSKLSESETSLAAAITTEAKMEVEFMGAAASSNLHHNQREHLHEGSGTVRRRSRAHRSSSRPQSTGDAELLSPPPHPPPPVPPSIAVVGSPAGAAPPPPPPPCSSVTLVTSEAIVNSASNASQRSSLSQTPDEEDESSESPSRVRGRRKQKNNNTSTTHHESQLQHSQSQEQPQGCSSPPSSKQQQQQHFRHFNHKEHETSVNSGNKYSLFSPPGHTAGGGGAQSVISEASQQQPRRGATIYTRPRSASIGNRLSDAEQTSEDHHRGGAGGHHGNPEHMDDHDHHSHYHHHYRHRRHHTLDGHHQHQGVHHGGHYEDEERHMMSFGGGGTTTSSRSISSKSEKSSSRSSQSPSVDCDMRHVFPGVPAAPGMPCQGEDRSIYRRGARRWRKLYKVNGHIFQAKRFNRRAYCTFCRDRIWGLGRQGFKCTQCKLLIHKKCHKLIRVGCDVRAVTELLEHNNEESAHRSHGSGSWSRPGNGATGHSESMDDTTQVSPIETPKDPDSNAISLADFDLIRVIGRGSYAKVLMVELKKTKRIYAMKVIKKELVTDDEDIDWVQTEKHVFETASNHPFLVGLHSCFQTPSRLFFVIEFVRGGDLMFHMQRKRRLPEEHARFYSAEICLALNFLHDRGIIYRDLKLDNVLLDHEGHIKLTDYGMCKEGIHSKGDTTSTFCGTPNYIAPEILRGEDYSFSVDWWALGVLLYEMLAGRSPFDVVGATDNPDQNTEDYLFQVILEKTIRIPRSLSVKANSILKGFLNKNPADRLGCNRESGFAEIMSHQFFRNYIDWELLEQKQVPPPYRPTLESDRDLHNFPPEFTDEPVQLTPDDSGIIDKIDQTEFDGFEYVNPLLMSAADVV